MFRRPFPVTTDHPRLAPMGQARNALWSVTTVLVALALLLGILFYLAQFSGSVQWFLGVGFLTAFAALAWALILRRSADPAPLVGPATEGAYRDGDLAILAAATRRAGRGLAYSQVLVASRARNAFLEKARLATGLSPESMRAVQRDPAALRRMFRDGVIEDFVHLDVGDPEAPDRWVVEARERGGFARKFEDVLKRMEAWK